MNLNIKNSSAIESAHYYPARKVLKITFTKGSGTLKYRDVPADIAEGLKTAESAGRYYQTHIREKYEFERVG